MTVSIDTLRALANVDPFKEGRAPLGRGDECLARLDNAGLLPYMARTNKTGPDLNNYLWYYQSKDGHEYLRADVDRRTDSSKITEIAIKRLSKDAPDLADEYRHVLAQQGGAAVFQMMAAEVRRHDLAQIAGCGTELASPEEAQAHRNRGRSM